MATLGLVHGLLVLSVFVHLFPIADGALTKTPQNVVVLRGEDAVLDCSVDSSSSNGRNPINWRYDGDLQVSVPCTSHDKSKIITSPTDSPTDCNLRVLGSSATVISGAYRCEVPRLRTQALAMVIVLDPICEVVQPAIKGQSATLMCRMTYYWQAPAKNFNYPPELNISLSWTGVTGTTVKTTANPSTFRGTVETNMTIGNIMSPTIPPHSCMIEFNFSPGYSPGGFSTLTYAVNTVSSTCATKETTVWYCPTWVTIDVDTKSTNGSLKSGDILTCKSDGHPQPSYTWIGGNGEIVASGPNITLTQTYEKLTCMASSDFTTPCSQWKTRYNVTLETVSGDSGGISNREAIIIGVVIAVFVLLVVVIIIIIVIFRRRRQYTATERKPRRSRGAPSGDGNTNVEMSEVDLVGNDYGATSSAGSKSDIADADSEHDLGDGPSAASSGVYRRDNRPASRGQSERSGSDPDYTDVVSKPRPAARTSLNKDGNRSDLGSDDYVTVDHRARQQRPDA